MMPSQKRALKELKQDPSLVIVPADKGWATILMDGVKYGKKMQDMLDDTDVYCKLKRDPFPALERKMNSMLLQLNRNKEIPDAIYWRLRSSNGKTPLLYGLPKIHKVDVPMRPIVSFLHSPTYHLSKHLCSLLSPLVGNSASFVRNSKHFVQLVSRFLLMWSLCSPMCPGI